MIQKAIYYVLINDATFKAAIGTDERGKYKVYPLVAPNEVSMPFCVYRVTGSDPIATKGSVAQVDDSRISIIVYDTEYYDAVNLSVLIRDALDNYTGTANGVVVQRIEYAGSSDVFDANLGTRGVFGIDMEFNTMSST